jgi:hypothetical protein
VGSDNATARAMGFLVNNINVLLRLIELFLYSLGELLIWRCCRIN